MSRRTSVPVTAREKVMPMRFRQLSDIYTSENHTMSHWAIRIATSTIREESDLLASV